MKRVLARATLAAAFSYVAAPALAQPASQSSLADLSLEELANLEITSVSRRAERLSDAPASIFAITGNDIRSSGATSLPEALRLAPNLQVARVDARNYAISARGFNSTAANKLLVLIDGRTVYTPLFSGVFWDAQDVFLEDLQRIEVISGPGATLWGANAVNGVINVISRPASETKGVLVFAGGGNREYGFGARYGMDLSGGAMRIYGKGFDRDNTVRANGTEVRDGWQNGQAGFRADWGSALNGFTLQGDTYRGTLDQGGDRFSGSNLLARWSREFGAGNRFQLQAYFDQTERDVPGTFVERLDTFDVELQHAFQAAAGHHLTWGAGYRRARDRVTNSPGFAFLPAQVTQAWSNVFVQDEIDVTDSLRFTVGIKFASNPYTSWEVLPSARLAWKVDASRMVWGALSRAVRAPSRFDRDLFIPGQPPFLLGGGPSFQSEIANVLELGYRAQPSPRLSYSLTAFRAEYDRLASLDPTGAGSFVVGNTIEASTQGLEAWGNFQAARNWRLSAGTVFLDEERRVKAGSGDASPSNDPKRQFLLRSSLDLADNQELDVTARYVSRLPNPVVPSYVAVDARYAWRPNKDLELSIVAQNLFDPRHPEFGAPATRSEIERSVFFKAKWAH